jgi:hypothetical protein
MSITTIGLISLGAWVGVTVGMVGWLAWEHRKPVSDLDRELDRLDRELDGLEPVEGLRAAWGEVGAAADRMWPPLPGVVPPPRRDGRVSQ